MTTTLQLGLLLLIFVAMLFLIVIGIYLVKLIIDLNKLANNLNDTTCMVKKEIEPLLEELKTTLTNINSVAKSADDKFNTIRKILTTVFNILMMCIIFFFLSAVWEKCQADSSKGWFKASKHSQENNYTITAPAVKSRRRILCQQENF